MVNYTCAFSQSESGKYFEWIINVVNRNTCLSLQQNVLLFECLSKYRIVSSAKKYDRVTPFLKSLSWLPAKDQLYYAKLLWPSNPWPVKPLNILLPQFITSEQVSERTTRSSQELNIPLFRTASGQTTFYYRTVNQTLEQCGIFSWVKPICWNF